MPRAPRLALLLAALVLASIAFAACGDDDLRPPASSTSPTASGAVATTPAFTPTPTPASVEVLYVVQDGDTLAGIAEFYGVTIEELMGANDITDPDSLQVGDVLTIPGVTVTPIPTDPRADTGTATAAPTDPPAEEVTLLQLVDKQHPLPAGYIPSDIVPVPSGYIAPGYGATMNATALVAMQQMIDNMSALGYDVRVVSGYRSYSDQEYTYNYWVQQVGQAEADRISARPGYSEHQLGTTADVGSADFGWDLREEFGSTPEGQWIEANGATYGFVVSYPQGKEAITGYAYEPWHLRYIGQESAIAYKASGLTLNQYLATLQ